MFTGVGERTREGNDLYHEMQETGVIQLEGESKVALVFGQMNEPPGARARVALTGRKFLLRNFAFCVCFFSFHLAFPLLLVVPTVQKEVRSYRQYCLDCTHLAYKMTLRSQLASYKHWINKADKEAVNLFESYCCYISP